MFSLSLYEIFLYLLINGILFVPALEVFVFKVIFGSLLLFPRPKGKKVKREKSRSLALRIKPKKQKKEKETKEKDKKKKKKSETLSPPQAPSKGVTLQDLSSKYKFSPLTAFQLN